MVKRRCGVKHGFSVVRIWKYRRSTFDNEHLTGLETKTWCLKIGRLRIREKICTKAGDFKIYCCGWSRLATIATAPIPLNQRTFIGVVIKHLELSFRETCRSPKMFLSNCDRDVGHVREVAGEQINAEQPRETLEVRVARHHKTCGAKL